MKTDPLWALGLRYTTLPGPQAARKLRTNALEQWHRSLSLATVPPVHFFLSDFASEGHCPALLRAGSIVGNGVDQCEPTTIGDSNLRGGGAGTGEGSSYPPARPRREGEHARCTSNAGCECVWAAPAFDLLRLLAPGDGRGGWQGPPGPASAAPPAPLRRSPCAGSGRRSRTAAGPPPRNARGAAWASARRASARVASVGAVISMWSMPASSNGSPCTLKPRPA